MIRQATQSDAKKLAALILASGPETLAAMFDINNELTAFNFLCISLTEPEGQYGYLNHWVALDNEEVVACVSAWHSQLTDDYHQATLKSLVSFYGTPHVHTIIRNSLIIQDCIPKPATNEWCIGHLSVSPSHQRKGYGRTLLALVEKQGKANHKTYLSLDVATNNTSALSFYERQGFVKSAQSIITQRMAKLGVGAHSHFRKRL